MKCDGCPIGEECYDQGCSNDGSCHLTLADFDVIKEAIEGKGKLVCFDPDKFMWVTKAFYEKVKFCVVHGHLTREYENSATAPTTQ